MTVPGISPLTNILSMLTVASVVDILLVAFLIYQFIIMIRGRRAAPILAGIAVLAAVYAISVIAQLDLLRTALAAMAPYTAFAVIVMFQSELRRMLSRLGRTQFRVLSNSLQRREVTQEIMQAVAKMAADKTGALIIMERDTGLRTFVESGVPLDSLISRDLLLAIFEHGSALHDGAVIIQGDRIAAAACFLPLTMNPNLLKELGTRHRAAIGITEEADCLSLIVSEETGKISIAAFGDIETGLTLEKAEQRIVAHARRKDPRGVAPSPVEARDVAEEAPS